MQRLGQTGLEVSRIGLGCMRMASLTEQETAKVLDTVVGQGINFLIMRIFMVVVNQKSVLLRGKIGGIET